MKLDRILGFFVLLATVAGLPTSATADDVHCPPFLGSVTIDGNVLVAAPCRLEGTRVIGNVHLYAGGSLIARGGTRIDGSIQAERSDFIDVADTHVNGNIQLDDLVGDRSVVERSTIGGSIQLKGNRSRLEVLRNTVDADVQAFSNTGGVIIADNVIDGNLQCKTNSPPPAGGNNRVQGNKEDQCANLMPEGAAPAPIAGLGSGTAELAGSSGGGSIGMLTLLFLALFLMARRAVRGLGHA